ncbi:hypothetical protein FWH09_01465 [Candidatus Saccharibacteria bacterium]|nr:hypothetical protein [Candidatus Saccharibacteria bacterium]
MDWRIQLGVSIIVPVMSSLLTYLVAIKKSKDEIEAVKIKSNNEIQKIREASSKEIERMRASTEEQIKLRLAERELTSRENDEKMKNEMTTRFLGEFMKDPRKGMETFATLTNLVNKLPKGK